MLKDGHIHTPFCPHGTKDPLEEYVEKAISLGFKEISFTEHAPLPEGFTDTAPTKDSAMQLEVLDRYFEEVNRVKSLYQNTININVGLEVDYIEGFEAGSKDFLNKYGNKLDDAVLSVHFLKYQDTYDCLDYSPDYFEKMIGKYGSVEKIYEKYFETLLMSIASDLGPYKPRRLGHITLVKKFQRKFPVQKFFKDEILLVLQQMKEKGYELDYNGAGTAKPLCREHYPPNWVIDEAVRLGIPLIYGSDAHQAKELSQGLSTLYLPK
ncbi:histidinol-phosphatase HisJ [Cytobacillus sp. FJAT-54145]|uniref:Histidinol-phosphatase n=1 Tax=Cytobacillus spartinae TaxID=3299023 RepID=A0ABW6KK96_9BACI